MRLLFVIDNLSTGGAQRQMVNLAVTLQQRGHRITLFRYAPGDLLADRLGRSSVEVISCYKRARYSPDVICALREMMRRGQYDVALSYLATPNFYLLTAALGLRLRPKIVVSERSCDPPTGPTRREAWLRQLYRGADLVVTNSHHQRENFQRRYRWLADRVVTIYNGIDLVEFCPPASEPPPEPLRLLAIGSVSPYKNGLCLIEALAILRDTEQLQPQVDWVGQRVHSLQERAEYLARMEQVIAELGLTSQWNWLDQRRDVVELLHQHHALVHASYWEGLPNVVCEALACGRPVLVSNVLDHPRLVQAGVSGYLFDWREPRSLADSIVKLQRMTAVERHVMGQQGREFAEQHLSETRFADEYEELFRALAAR